MSNSSSSMMIFTGTANIPLADRVAQNLNLPLGKATIDRFSDGEIRTEILENVRGRDVFVIQPTCAPSNDTLMELIIMCDAFRRASAGKITAVVPYFGYARQDRRVRSMRVPITAKIVADMLTSVGFNRLLTVDLHADQIQGFFYIPVDNIYATPAFMSDMLGRNYPNPVVVSPDIGGVVRARAVAKCLHGSDLAIIDKRRPHPNEAKVMNIIGDVEGKNCILVDDIVDTASTLCQAAMALKRNGAASVSAYCTHPVLSGPAIENIKASPLDELVVSNSIPLQESTKSCRNIRQLDISPLLAKTIQRINEEESVSSMFREDF